MKPTLTLPRLTRILSISPFTITALWTTAEIRQNDFTGLFDQWQREQNPLFAPISEYDTFKEVAISPSHTLHWPNVPVRVTLANRTIDGTLDIDPDELYRHSTLIRQTKPLPIGNLLRQARLDAGLSQLDVATKSGTTRNYISRIENGKSDIQIETLNKIVQVGMGKHLRVEID